MARRPTGKMIKAVIDNIADGVIGIDKEGKVILCNGQAQNMLKDIDSNPIDKKLWDIMEINDFVRTFTSLVKNSDSVPLEQVLPFYGKNLFLVKMLPVKGSDNRIVGAIAILRDMTDIHNMEMAVNEFVCKVSHELKTPLTSIKGFIETLLEGALNEPKVTRKFLQVVNEETNRLTRLVINLLDLTHMIQLNGKEELTSPIDTLTFINEVLKLFEPIAQKKKITLTSSIPKNIPPININPDKLRQVLINIVDNAIKFTSIKEIEGEVNLSATLEENSINIKIKDTGIGIAPEEFDSIFEKFYRISKGPASQLGGTGLGLSIAQEIVESHGGKITVKSILNKGSTFEIKIPCNDK